MTFKNLRKYLPTKKVDYMRYTREGWVRRIDVAGALYGCALQDASKYLDGDYSVAWAHWQRLLQQLKRERLLDAELVFDGQDNPHKSPERQRRDSKAAAARTRINDAKEQNEVPASADLSAAIRNQPEYIKGCFVIGEWLGFKCIVAPTEADAYVAGVDCDGKVISLSQDGDMALWSDVWIGPTSWFTGRAILIDFTSFTSDDAEKFPLVAAYLRHGKKAIILAAAFADSDFVAAGATRGIGWEKAIDALTSIKKNDLTPSAVTAHLKKNYPKLAKGKKAAKDKYWSGVTAAMNSVLGAVSGAVYYAEDGSTHSASKQVAPTSTEALKHMKCQVNPRTSQPFSSDEQEALDGLDPAELTCPSQVPQKQMDVVQALTDTPTAEQARRFIVGIGGSTRKDGKALTNSEAIQLALKYKAAAEEIPFPRVNRSDSGGIFLPTAVTSKTENVTTIRTLLNHKKKEIDKVEHMNLRAFLSEVNSAYIRNAFVTGDDVTLTAPEWSPHLLSHFYAPLASGAESTKAMRDAVKRATQMSELLYHAMARSEDGSRLFLSMKLRASMKSDKTAKAEEHGEKSERLPYMTLVEAMVAPTTVVEDGHELGRVWCIGRTYCTCPAGLALCEHKGTGMEVQSLHWDEGRPEEKPTHFHKKCWGKYGRKRKASVLAPLDELPMGSSSSDATQFRQCRDPTAKLDYDVADKALMAKRMGPARMAEFCALRRRNNNRKQTKKEYEMRGMSESESEGED